MLLMALLLGGVVFGDVALATDLTQNVTEQINAGADAAGFDRSAAADPRQVVTQIIQVALSFVAVLLIILILFAGFWYVTAGGDESKVEKAQKTLRSAIVGFVIVTLAYGITIAVSTYALRAQTRTYNAQGYQ